MREVGEGGRTGRGPGSPGAPGASFTTEVPWPSLWKFAQFAYVAEQYGYRYSGLDPELRDSDTPFFVFRALPDARERAAVTRARFPGALAGGRLPGMRAWPVPVLTLPEARGEVRLLHARIAIDYFGALGRQRLRPWLVGIPVVLLFFLLVNGELHVRGLTVAAGAAAALFLVLAASRIFVRRRLATHQRLLGRSDVRWPP
ncbi:membrane protein [Streptomyces sp. NRRL F-7442]|nr:membrane protein [Streptomyces sp. NRRL F-7442]